MALRMTKRGQADNELTYEFMCDTPADLQDIEPRYITLGSIATVIQGETGFEVYMANSQKEWVNLGSTSTNNSENNEQQNNNIIIGTPIQYRGAPINYFEQININDRIITGKMRKDYYDDTGGTLILTTQSTSWYNEKTIDANPNSIKIAVEEAEITNNQSKFCSYGYGETDTFVMIQIENHYNLSLITPKYIHIYEIGPNEINALSNLDYVWGDDKTNGINNIFSSNSSSITLLETYDISQLEYIDYANWNQAGE